MHDRAKTKRQLIDELVQLRRESAQWKRLAAIGEAMTGLAHESRNALQRSQACLELLSHRVEDQPEVLELIQRLQQAQEDLHRLYEEVREYAAPVLLQPERHDLGSLFLEAWDSVVVMHPDRRMQLCETNAGVELACRVDAFAIQQVFRNVLENALDACPDPVQVDVRYSLGQLPGKPAIRAQIRDHGPGLTADQQSRIFDSFYTTKARGTGLGLPIARRLVEAHGGHVTAESPEGPGTEIVVVLPQHPG
jgi:signal transduction histidine kinase